MLLIGKYKEKIIMEVFFFINIDNNIELCLFKVFFYSVDGFIIDL